MGNAYEHGKPFFPKEILIMIIAAIVLAGAAVIFGPHILSATNSGVNTIADPAVGVPKTGDAGQLPAVVNETTPAPKQAEKISDNVRITGNGLKVKEFFDSTFQLSELQTGTIHFAEWKESVKQADFYLVVDRNNAAATLRDVVLEFKGTTVKNFAVTDNSNGITITAEIATAENFQETVSMLTATEKIPFTQYTLHSLSKRVESPKGQEILGQIYVSSSSEKERLSKTKILILHVAIIAK